jgi:hypothetical protein
MEQNPNMVLPPVVKFAGVGSAVSVYRLATFTGTRFFRSCALNVRGASPTAAPPAQSLTRSNSNQSAQSMPSRGVSSAATGVAPSSCRGSSPTRTTAANSSGESDTVMSSPVAPKLGSAPSMLSDGLCDEEPVASGMQPCLLPVPFLPCPAPYHEAHVRVPHRVSSCLCIVSIARVRTVLI